MSVPDFVCIFSAVIAIVFGPVSPVWAQDATATAAVEQNCEVTPPQESAVFDGSPSLAGDDPIWLTSRGTLEWFGIPTLLPPYPGRIAKMLIYTRRGIDGDLTLTTRNLSGGADALFPLNGAQTQVDEQGNDIGSVLDLSKGEPATEWVWEDVQTPRRNAQPPGFIHYGFLVYFPEPGCYEFEAKLNEYVSIMVVEVRYDPACIAWGCMVSGSADG